jgi:hypothetical protein
MDAEATVTKVGPEIRSPAKLADHIMVVQTLEADWIDHNEAVSWWKDDTERWVAERVGTLAMVPELKKHNNIRVTITLLERRGAPAKRSLTLMVDRGDYSGIVRPRWVEMYSIPAREAFEADTPEALAMVPLMDSTPQDLVEAKRRLEEIGNENSLAQFLALAARKCDSNELRRQLGMFERATMEMVRSSEWVLAITETARHEAREAGLQEGRQEGRQEGVLRSLRRVLSHRFPGLREASLARIPEDRLEGVLEAVLEADTEDSALAAITEGARTSQ